MSLIFNKIIKFVYIILFLALFSTVFVVSKDLGNGVVSGKYYWFYLSIGVISAFTLFFIFSKKIHFKFALQDFVLCLFVVSMLFSTYLKNGEYNQTKIVLLLLLTCLYFYFRISFTFNSKIADIACYIIIFTGLCEAIIGYAQLYGFYPSNNYKFKITGTFFNPGPYAGYLAVVFSIAFYYCLYPVKSKLKWNPFYYISILTVIAIIVILPATMSRAAWVATFTGTAIISIKYVFDKKNNIREFCRKYKKKLLIAGSSLLLLLCLAFAGLYFIKKDSANGRLLTWKVGLQAAKTQPLGGGLGNFPGAYGNAQADYFANGDATEVEEYVAGNVDYAFNEFIQILVEGGWLTFICYLLLLYLALKSAYHKQDFLSIAGIVALLVFSFFSYPYNILPFLIVFVFLLARSADNKRGITQPRRVFAIFTILICFTLTVLCVINRYPAYNAYKEWNKDKILYSVGIYDEVAEKYEFLYPYLNDQTQFLFEYAQSLSKTEAYEKSNNIIKRAIQISCDPMFYNIMGKNYQAMQMYNEAETCFIKASRIVPSRIYPYYLLVKLYMGQGLFDKAKACADIILTKEIKIESQATEEMKNEIKKLIYEND